MFGANEGTLPMRVAAVPTIGAINRRENIVVHFLSFWTKKSRSHVAKNNSTAVITNSNVGEDRGSQFIFGPPGTSQSCYLAPKIALNFELLARKWIGFEEKLLQP